MQCLRVSMRLFLLIALGLSVADMAGGASTKPALAKHKAQPAAQSPLSSVEVINGGSRVTQSFGPHQTTSSSTRPTGQFRPEYVAGHLSRPATTTSSAAESTPANGVVIFNGNQKETHVFNTARQNQPVRNQTPVVIGIAASGSLTRSTQPVVIGISSEVQQTQSVVVNVASAGSNSQPVVVGVASSGIQNSGTAEPVAVGVSPRRAKRQPYRPAALDAQ